MSRGSRRSLTGRCLQIARERIGVTLTIRHLRLLPYLDYCAKNGKCVDEDKIECVTRPGELLSEYDIYQEFKVKGFFDSTQPLVPTKQFYDAMQEILYYSYVLGEKDE